MKVLSIMGLQRKTLRVLCFFLLFYGFRIIKGALPTCTPTSSGSLNVQSSCKISSPDGTFNFSELIVDKSIFFESTLSSSFHTVNVTGRLKIGLLGSLIIDKNRNLGGVSGGVSLGGLGSGGSHAGRGGSPKLAWLPKDVATPKGDPFDPKDVGGSGGDGTTVRSGGAGGGGIQIWSNICEISGSIQANGQDAEESKNGGGGAGGSISLECNQLIGKPILEARGGLGDGDGGGGSGGRIRLQFETGNFDGETGLHAQGGKVGKLQKCYKITFL